MNSRANDPAAMAEDWGRTPVERVERDSETRGRGRGRGKSTRGGRGRGGHQNDQNRTQDGGWAQKTGDPVPTPIPLEKAAMEAKDTTLIGMNDYGSSEDHDDDSSSISSSSSDSSLDSSYSGESSGDSDSDDDGDGKETISPTPVEAVVHKPTKPVCKFFAKNGKCNRGNRCTFEHTVSTSFTDSSKNQLIRGRDHGRQACPSTYGSEKDAQDASRQTCEPVRKAQYAWCCRLNPFASAAEADNTVIG